MALKVNTMARCALFVAVTAICAWLSVPLGQVSMTLQTLGIFLCLGLLGGKAGTLTVLVYLLLGLLGLPVFDRFRGGIGALMGPTGGFLLGFALCGITYWGITALKNTPAARLLAMVAGQAVCYLCGSLWFMLVYLPGTGLAAVLMSCVVPYLLPDAAKLLLAWWLTQRIKRFV